MNHRLKRFEKLLSHLIHEWFSCYKPPNISTHQFTIEKIQLSRDLRQAKILVTSLEHGNNIIQLLQPHLKSIQAHIAKNITSKSIPKVSFTYDTASFIIKNHIPQ
ncbi:MAG TPA: ribosome-binding factor A [Gammaproteobacteria bacterium]|nr:ribosome-binding factor A [Gammaproteobacteria bacterium]